MTFTNHRTLVDVLLAKSVSQRAVTFITGQDQHLRLPYSELLTRARHRLAQFQALGLQPGSQLIIQTQDNAAFLEGFWACLLGGITAVPVSGGNSSEHRFKLFRIADKLNNPGIYTDQSTLQRLSEFAAANSLSAAYSSLSQQAISSDVPAPENAEGEVHQALESDTAFIQFSSGSTSTPKGVVLTHENLMFNLDSIIDGCKMSEQDSLFSWMPLTHDMGLIGFHLAPLYRDVDQSLMPTDVFVRRPGLWLSEAAAVKATFLCSPNFGYQHLLKSFKPEKYPDLDLSSVRLLFNGAEPISTSLCDRFMQAMAPFKLDAGAMFPVYGLAEASLAVTFSELQNSFSTVTIQRAKLGVGETIQMLPSGSDDSDGVSFVGVGKPVKHVSLQIRDAQGVELDNATTGNICIHGKNVTQGYYQEPELNASTIDANGWLNTGDLGFIHNGQLFITGRAKDIIFVSGQNVYPHDLEEIVLQAELVERGKLAISSYRQDDAAEEQLVVFILHRGEPEALQDVGRSITRLLGEEAGVRVHAVVPVTRIPKTTSGKVQRYLLIESLLEGEFTPLLQPVAAEALDDADAPQDMSEQSTAEVLLAICNSNVDGMSVGLDDNLFDLGISSLMLAQIHAAIEEQWPDQVDITDLFDYPTVAELAAFLDARSGV